MPRRRKCQACRDSKKYCSEEIRVWNEHDPETRCTPCKTKNLSCGPNEYKDENDEGGIEANADLGQSSRAEGDGQPLASLPNRLLYTKEGLDTRLLELDNWEYFHIAQQQSSDLGVPEQLLRVLKDIEELAHQARAAHHNSEAEVVYNRLIGWYEALGEGVRRPRQNLILKVGAFFETTGHKGQAEMCYMKIFKDIDQAQPDAGAPFHHAIRNFDTYGQVSQDALRGIIRCCPLCRFTLRNAMQQTLLHLAVFATNEEIVVAIMLRIRDHQQRFWINPIYLDARDCTGHTILTTAVLLGYSISMINAFIQYGSCVNPEQWVDGALSPLQAASYPGFERFDIAVLLLQHGAHMYPRSTFVEGIFNNRSLEPLHVPMIPELDQPPHAQNRS